MELNDINEHGLVLLGCGKMGSAMLQGWLAQGLAPTSVYILDPKPSAWVQSLHDDAGLHLNTPLPAAPSVCVLAVKPQMMGDALPQLQKLGNGTTLFVSIAAGTSISSFEQALGVTTPIVRAMPNTPAAIGKGITALIGNTHASAENLTTAQVLLAAVGQTVLLSDEAQMDAVTAVSGSGPAYVFHLIEAMAQAGEKQGLPADMALQLAKATVAGAGELAALAPETPTELRVNVTSPGGTTQAALNVLMDEATGFPPLLDAAISAAAKRGKELGQG